MDASGVTSLTVRKSRHPVHFEERLKLIVNSWRAVSASNGFGNSSRNPSNARRTLARPCSFTNCSKMMVARTSSWKRKPTASSKRSFTSDSVSIRIHKFVLELSFFVSCALDGFCSVTYIRFISSARLSTLNLGRRVGLWGLKLSDFLANEIFDLSIQKVIEPNTSQISHSRCMIFQGDFPSFVELPDIDSRPCFESCLFFVCHRRSI